ncbi:hypothetical protein [Actinomadura sp. NEAU-AAG7]|uniref:hypothetical protein n=1 Tax=Actinomadura sp. NEAU-AAG7 TaxID=2839640 RepID=UPI001BE3EEE7|nr:hypothetical protein [Actinomadura sp. NEAU-AAG7]MBT2208692.1 hypothetical protein [Actinomadura sp. NEAU-AAG7]
MDLWFDPMTHALQMGGVGDFRFYDEYDLWDADRGDLTTSATRRTHIDKVFGIQDRIGAPHLAPTVLLHHGLSDTSLQALNLSREAVERDPGCWLSIAGTSPFWASESALDAHVGALAQLNPKGWFVTVVRPVNSLPVEAIPEETHGLCRTVRALSEYAPVHVSHGDIAALPAVAAGASTIGTGWDKRQRVCSFADYAARPDHTEGGSGGTWYMRPTLTMLLGSLSQNEAALLRRLDAERATKLGGIPAPGAKESFFHHLQVLNTVISEITVGADNEQRYRRLVERYSIASREWPAVQRLTNSPQGAAEWIHNLQKGLIFYGETEGWSPTGD